MTIAVLPEYARAVLPEIKAEHFFNSETIAAHQAQFLTLCQTAEKVIMHHWLRTKEIAESPNSLIAAKRLAEEIIAQNKNVKIFVLPCGGAYDAPIHEVAGVTMILSLSDKKILTA